MAYPRLYSAATAAVLSLGGTLALVVVPSGRALAQCDTLIDQDFDHWDDRRYSIDDAKRDFNGQVKPWTASTYRGISGPGAAANLIEDVPQETRIVDGTLRAEYKANDASGRSGGFLFDAYFDGQEEAFLSYKLKFDEDFFWATGGKLPGLGGSTRGVGSETEGRGAIPSGCQYNDDGFSARLMWRRNRAQTDDPYLILYSYFAEKPDGSPREETSDCGDNYRVYTGLEEDTWYTITQYLRLNTPGQRDGAVVIWIDGEEAFRKEDFLIRKTGKDDLRINALIMNTYRGGARNDEVWHSPRDEFAFFDDFRVWTGGLGCSGINQRPVLDIVSPLPNATYEVGESIAVEVSASDPDGTVAMAELYLDDELVRAIERPPFTWGGADDGDARLRDLAQGAYRLRAVVTDDQGSTNSEEITVTVGDVQTAPTARFTKPADGAIYLQGDSVVVDVAASDPNGEVAKVDLYLNDVFLRKEAVAPYEWGHRADLDAALKDMRPGTYVLRAVVEDNDGESTASSITITVEASSSIREVDPASVRIVPSATSDRLSIALPEALLGRTYRVTNVSGQVVMRVEAVSPVTEVSVAGLASGVYFVDFGGVGRRFVRR